MISLAFEDQRHFIGILALKSSELLDQGCAPDVMDKLVAQKLWVDRSAITEVKRRLIEVGLIDSNWQPLAWNKRQFSSDRDPTNAERQRKFREKQRSKQDDQVSRVTNALHNTPVTALDTDTDTENIASIDAIAEIEVEVRKCKNARGARLSLSQLPDEWRAWARKERPDLDTEATWQIFRDHWAAMPGARGCKADWLATWRNWVRREKSQTGDKNGQHNETATDRRARINRTLIEAGQRAFDEMGCGPDRAFRGNLAQVLGG